MAELDFGTILAALSSSQEAAAQDNPWKQLDSFSASAIPTILKEAGSGDMSPEESIIGGILTGLFSGLTNNLSTSYMNDQRDFAIDALKNSMSGRSVLSGDGPEGISRSVLNSLRTFDTAQKMNAENEARVASRNLASKVMEKRIEGAVQNPYAIKEQEAAINSIVNPEKKPAPVVEAGKLVNPVVPVQQGLAQPSAPVKKAWGDYMREAGGNEAAAKSLMDRDLEAPDKVLSKEEDLRRQFQAQKPIVDFTEMSKNMATIQQAAKDMSAVGDLDLGYSIARILDPNSVIRETEVGAVVDSQSMPAATIGRIERLINGDASIGVEGRRNLVNMAIRRYQVQKGLADSTTQHYNSLAQQAGIEPGNVTFLPQVALEPFNSGEPQEPAVPPGMKLQRNKITGETRIVPQ